MVQDTLDDQLGKLRIEKTRKQAFRRRGRWGWWLLAVVACAGVGFLLYRQAHAPLLVRVAKVASETLEAGRGPALVTASGYVVPRHKVEVSSKIVGRVKEVKISRGDRVNQGDVLILLEDDEYQAQLRSAEAQAASLKARLAELEAGSRPQEIAAAAAAVVSSEASLKNAELDYTRALAMEKDGVVATSELDRALAARDIAKARLDADKKNAELVKIGPRAEVVAAARAQWQEAAAQVEYIRTQIDNTVIRAPISGVILEKLAEQGELVTNMNLGGTRGAKSSVVSMADLGDLQVEADLNEMDVAKVKAGQAAEIRMDADAGKAYPGTVDEISPQADRQKGTVQVKVRFLETDDAIKTETNARVTFFGEAAENGAARTMLYVPKSAVQQDNGSAFVYVLSGGKAVKRAVTLGVEAALGVEVMQGLGADELVIVSPLEQVSDGRAAAALTAS